MKKWERLDTTKFVARARLVHGEKCDYSKTHYVNSKSKVIIACLVCGHEWQAFPHNHLNGQGCKNCCYKRLPQNQGKTHKKFVKDARKVHGNKYEYLSHYQSGKATIQAKCNDCGSVFTQRASSHLEGRGCKTCQYASLPQNQPRDVGEFEDRCRRLHDDKYEYCGDYRGGRYKIKIFCKHHQEYFYQNADAHLLKQQGCPKCNLSRGEQRIEKFLKGLGIKHECEKQFPDCKHKLPLAFDFYLPDHNLCIEYDGELHYYPIARFGGKKRLSEIQLRDQIKNEFCKDSGIRLLRIPFFDYSRVEIILQEALGC